MDSTVGVGASQVEGWMEDDTVARGGRSVPRAPRRRPRIRLAGALLLTLTLAACGGGDDIRDADGAIASPGPLPVFDLRDGDCLDPAPDLSGEIADIAVVPCADPHSQEVFATIQHPEGAYPGASDVARWADGACLSELESDHGLTLDDGLFVSYLLPTFVGWNKDDDRRVVCVLVFPDREAVAGSVVAGTADIEPSQPVEPQLDAAGGEV